MSHNNNTAPVAGNGPAPEGDFCDCTMTPAAPEEEMDGEYRTARHWPLKLRLAPLDEPLLQKAHLLICGDCTAFATLGFHQSVGDDKAILIGCPKFEDPRALGAKLEELFSTVRPASCLVARMEKPCCKGLDTLCREAAKKVMPELPVREIVVYCSGRIEGSAEK